MCGSISKNCTTSLCAFVCVRERLCACSLNPLLVKTQFVWELKETGELLKLAEASLIENQQTTETPQHTHTVRPVQCNTHRVPYSQSLHMKNVDCSCWAKLVDFTVCNCRWTAVAFQTSSYRLLLLQLTTAGKNIIPPGSQHLQLVVWTQFKSQTRFMKSFCCLALSNPLKIHSDGISVLLDKQRMENKRPKRVLRCNLAL